MRIGTRGSALALAQAQLVANSLDGESELIVIKASGDEDAARDGDSPTNGAAGGAGGRAAIDGGDKSRWVGELERALLDGRIDLAVHSAKDVPGVLSDGLELLGAPPRASPLDALIGTDSLEQLPHGARIGTSSLRRRAQLLAARGDLDVVNLRGNVDTRLQKLHTGQLDAIVLASAGLERLGRAPEIGVMLELERFVPAPGQGALALQARAGDERTAASVRAILDEDTGVCLRAERALAAGLEADCDTPLGAHAAPSGDGLHLRGWIGVPDGSAWLLDELVGDFEDPEGLGGRVAERLARAGASELLQRAREMALERA